MKFQKLTFIICIFFIAVVSAQTIAPQSIYRKEKDKVHELQHTKLVVSLDFKKKELNGEAWLTLKPYFYATNKVTLDAKAMLIHSIQLKNKDVGYNYDGEKIIVELPRAYTKDESFILDIKYTARPEKVQQKGSAAITEAKGLYFINADGLDTSKPTQVWTQGETEASSCWFPTIDSPNQKTSQELTITVPNKFKTLSNGTLEKQTNNANGTRTDYWNFKRKHAPYLFFLGVGEYEIIKDSYKMIPVEYYVEKKYAPYAKDIFGLTPEMMAFFSKITGVEYPWSKFSQIVGRDYVSGAMENTTAVVHGEKAYQMPGQLIDENVQENTIAHELFHHWFGDLVTAESWSNITLNESFANYSEYLWREHKYGKDDANAHLLEDVEAYKQGKNFDKDLVRYFYKDKEDLFDTVSYNKGGAILHMLKNYVGDDAFFASLKLYLTENKYKSAEVAQLRLAFEKVTGKDLNWFFNQWYFSNGHPKIQVSYDYNTLEKRVAVNILQTEGDFKFPLAIDIVENGKVTRKNVFVDGKDASFVFSYSKTPENILVNADGVLLADFTEAKTTSQYISQLKYTTDYGHKKEAILAIVKLQSDKKVFEAIASALDDPFYKIRILAIENIDLFDKSSKRAVIDKIKKIALQDEKTLVRAAAIETLGKLTEPGNLPLFEEALKSKSYSVLGKTLVAIYYIDKAAAIKLSKELPNDVRKIIATPLTRIFIEENDETELEFIAQNVLSGMFLNNDNRVQGLYKRAYDKISKSNSTKAIQNLVDDIVAKGIQFKQFNFDKTAINLLQQMVETQKNSGVSNRNKHILIIRTGLAKLVN
ncbi:Aminopeptidase N [Polaribacter huanghezhanensis]|uniref:M1 family metallopeptidase n=1 Tax=Polaribacter huanghezhanensis TaxID=1354726 RepID=UPI0026494364|nr:M1 family metallopeptidase [Polaribacter huanghezhanensis]WKD86685.1 Aminopeptidase N [Polaribacter huanghezhanensis]